MNNLEKVLVKSGEKKQDDLATQAKLLLAVNEQKELDVLKAIGLNAEIQQKEEILEDLIIRQKGQEKYKAQIVHKDDIQKLLLNYRLYMRPANSFRGRIPPTIGAELVRFCEEKNIVLSPNNPNANKFYIIAPPKMFYAYKSPLDVLKESVDVLRRENQKFWASSQDPILVYRTDNKDYYAVIKSWGNDFTPLRRVYGFFTRRVTMNWLVLPILRFVLPFLALKSWHLVGTILLSGVKPLEDKVTGQELVVILGWCIIGVLVVLWIWLPPFQEMRTTIRDVVTRVNEPTSRNRSDE